MRFQFCKACDFKDQGLHELSLEMLMQYLQVS